MSGPAKSDVQIVADAAAANREIDGLRSAIDGSVASAAKADGAMAGLSGKSTGLSKAFGALGVSSKGVASAMKDAHGTAGNLAGLMGPLGSGISTTTSAAKGLISTLMTGGPWGIAIGAAGLAVTLLTKYLGDAKEAADDLIESTGNAADDLAAQVRAATKRARDSILQDLGVDPIRAQVAELEAEFAAMEAARVDLAKMSASEIVRTYDKRLDAAKEARAADLAALDAEIDSRRVSLDMMREDLAENERYTDASNSLSKLRQKQAEEEARARKRAVQASADAAAAEKARLADAQRDDDYYFKARRQAEELAYAEEEARLAALDAAEQERQALRAWELQEEFREFDQIQKDKTDALAWELDQRRMLEEQAAQESMRRSQHVAAIMAQGVTTATFEALNALEDYAAGNEVQWQSIVLSTTRGVGESVMMWGIQTAAAGLAQLLATKGAVGMPELLGGAGLFAVGGSIAGVSAVGSGAMSQIMGQAGSVGSSASTSTEMMVAGDFRTTRAAAPESQGVTVQHHYHAAVIGDTTTTSRTIAEGSERARRDLLAP